MMRTTISLHESTFSKVKELSRQEHTSLGETITELLDLGLYIKKTRINKKSGKFTLETFPMGEARVPLEDKDAVYSILDEGK